MPSQRHQGEETAQIDRGAPDPLRRVLGATPLVGKTVTGSNVTSAGGIPASVISAGGTPGTVTSAGGIPESVTPVTDLLRDPGDDDEADGS